MKPTVIPSITSLIPELSNSLKTIQPNFENEVSGVKQIAPLITYTLIATAVVGIMVYHYIKNHEEPRSQGVLVNSAKQNSTN